MAGLSNHLLVDEEEPVVCEAEIMNLDDLTSREMAEGASARFVHTGHMTVVYWRFEPGVPLPEHSHPHEQVTNVLEGAFEMTLAGETHRLEAGSVVVIPPDVEHGGRSLTACRILDVFHPVREDFR